MIAASLFAGRLIKNDIREYPRQSLDKRSKGLACFLRWYLLCGTYIRPVKNESFGICTYCNLNDNSLIFRIFFKAAATDHGYKTSSSSVCTVVCKPYRPPLTGDRGLLIAKGAPSGFRIPRRLLDSDVATSRVRFLQVRFTDLLKLLREGDEYGS